MSCDARDVEPRLDLALILVCYCCGHRRSEQLRKDEYSADDDDISTNTAIATVHIGAVKSHSDCDAPPWIRAVYAPTTTLSRRTPPQDAPQVPPMTVVMTREPLQTLNMASTQRTTRRRTVVHAFDEENDSAQPTAKRAKIEKQVNGVGKKQKACKCPWCIWACQGTLKGAELTQM